ncbi:MAG: virulence RhuM family protein, partial [Syntrophobacterales bacterium]|nr:virulence RhuM family protein [Syntrophobacterales bacterium]
MGDKHEIIIYQTVDGLAKIDVRMQGETLWLTQAQIAQLFGRERSVITKHIRNIFAEDELDEKSNVQNLHIPNSDRPVALYTLDIILAVGYRVKSPRGTQFRQWATRVLHEYLQKGFSINDDFLKNMGGGVYWKELLDRIRDIRASEKV